MAINFFRHLAFLMRMALFSLAPVLARLTVAAAIGLAAGGCWISENLVTSGLAAPGSPAVEKNPVLLVATTRRATAERPWFGSQRGRGLTFAEARLAAPDRSITGRVASIVTGDWALAGVEKVQSYGAANA